MVVVIVKALDVDRCVGAIVCKVHAYEDSLIRGYIAMLAVDKEYRRQGIGEYHQLSLSCSLCSRADQRCADREVLSLCQSTDFHERSGSTAVCNLESSVSPRLQLVSPEIHVMQLTDDAPST